MKLQDSRAIQILVYLCSALTALAAGVACSRAIAWELAGSRRLAFVVLLASALVVLFVGAVVEERTLWKGRLHSNAGVPGWIGRPRSSLLASTAPPPLSLGFLLGLLSALLV